MNDAIKLAIERAWPDWEPNWLPTDDEGMALFKLECEALAALRAQPTPPPECLTEAEKTAYAFGWWKGIESVRMAATLHTCKGLI